MVLQRWEPFRELRQMEDTMNRLWRGIGGLQGYREGAEDWNILIDVIQKKDDVIVKRNGLFSLTAPFVFERRSQCLLSRSCPSSSSRGERESSISTGLSESLWILMSLMSPFSTLSPMGSKAMLSFSMDVTMGSPGLAIP